MNVARAAADRVVFLDEGVVGEESPPEQVRRDPREAHPREFLASVL